MLELADKYALVTGGGRGIGRAIALVLAHAGATVTIADLDDECANAVAAEIRASGGRALTVTADVSSKQQVEDLLRQHVSEFQRLDIMVNNAGLGHVKPLLDVTEPEWDRVMSVNVKSVLFGIQAAAKEMIERKTAGRIINIASVAGKGGRGTGRRVHRGSRSRGAPAR